MWPIFGVSVIGWYIGLEKMIYLRKINRARSNFSKAVTFPKAGDERIKKPTGLASYDELLHELRASFAPDARRSELLFR